MTRYDTVVANTGPHGPPGPYQERTGPHGPPGPYQERTGPHGPPGCSGTDAERLVTHIVGGFDTKQGSAYTTDDGVEVPEHELYRAFCICGWRGSVWYASEEKAVARLKAHREQVGGAA